MRRRDAQKENVFESNASIIIQKHWRSYAVRRNMEAIRRAAVEIQAGCRGRAGRVLAHQYSLKVRPWKQPTAFVIHTYFHRQHLLVVPCTSMKPRQRFRNVGAGVQAGSRLTAFTEGNDTSTPFCGPTGNSGEFLVTTSNNNSSCAQLREQYLHLLSLSNHSTTSLETTSSSSSDQATTHSLTLNSQFWSRWNISFSPVRGLVCITLQLRWRKHRSPPMCFRQNNFHLDRTIISCLRMWTRECPSPPNESIVQSVDSEWMSWYFETSYLSTVSDWVVIIFLSSTWRTQRTCSDHLSRTTKQKYSMKIERSSPSARYVSFMNGFTWKRSNGIWESILLPSVEESIYWEVPEETGNSPSEMWTAKYPRPEQPKIHIRQLY